MALEERGFVKSKYVISERPRARGKALRVYTATGKVVEVKAELRRRSSNLGAHGQNTETNTNANKEVAVIEGL